MPLLPLLVATSALAAPLTPDRRGAVAPERNFDVQRLHLDLDLDLDGAVSGTATLDVARLWEGPLALHQVDLDIAAVDTGAVPSTWRVEGDRLLVEIDGDAASVAVTYRARPDTGLHFRKAERGGPDAYDEIWSQGEGEWHRFWFPSWDHPNDRFLFEGEVRGPDGLTVVTNAGQELVNYLVMVAVGPYEAHAHPEHPHLVTYAAPGTPPSAVARVTDPLPGMMAHFADRTGLAYPFGPYRQVFVQRFQYGAMENTSASTFGARFLVDDRVAGTRDHVESIVAHELAHQWFGDWLTCRTWRELWLNEGFATFMAADWFGVAFGDDAYADRILRSFARASGGGPMARRFHAGPDARDNSHVYVRGSAALHMLRVMLGEERFWAGVRRYVADGPRLVETAELQRALEEVSGRHLDWFFQQWVELSHTPTLTVSRAQKGDQLTVTVRQKATKGQAPFTLPLTVEAGWADGRTLRARGWIEDADATVTLTVEEAPDYVAFDPDRGALAHVTYTQDAAAWEAQLRHSPSPFARRDAVAALAETDASDALVEVAGQADAPATLRAAAARALGAQRRAAPLLPLLQDPVDRVRQAAAEALGDTVGQPAEGALEGVVRRDPNPDVRASALAALARVRPEAAVRAARRLTRLTDREEHHLRGEALAVLGEHGAASDLDALLDPRAPHWLPRKGATAAARLVARQEGSARTRMARTVAAYCEDRLSDRDVRTRSTMIGVLAEVGDERSVKALEAYRRGEAEPGLARAAREAITRIEGRADPAPESPNETAARLEALEERLEALEEETARLEGRW